MIEPGRGLLRHALADEQERQQQAEARTRVRLEQEVDRAVVRVRGRGCDAERAEHAVVDRVVQEEDLADLDRDVGEGQQAGADDRADEVAEAVREPLEDRADARRRR